VRIADVLAVSGAGRAEFDRDYESLEDCYAHAYAAQTRGLVATLGERVAKVSGWRAGLRAGLVAIADFIESDPALAAGLAVEVRVVDGEAMARRRELVALGVGALQAVAEDPEARETPGDHSAELSVYTVEEAAATALREGDPARFRAALPDLAYLILAGSYSEQIARAESRLLAAGSAAS
jgi:hypothetical protein